jgi:hypothetical protein
VAYAIGSTEPQIRLLRRFHIRLSTADTERARTIPIASLTPQVRGAILPSMRPKLESANRLSQPFGTRDASSLKSSRGMALSGKRIWKRERNLEGWAKIQDSSESILLVSILIGHSHTCGNGCLPTPTKITILSASPKRNVSVGVTGP